MRLTCRNNQQQSHPKIRKKRSVKMFKNKKFSLIVIGALALTLALGLVAFAPTTMANAATPEGDDFTRGRGPGGGRPGQFENHEYLAEALGISTEELQAAHQVAEEAAIEQALEAGLITEAQAERLQNGNFRHLQMLIGPENAIDMNALLADALGISTDELNAAREAAKDAAIEQALEDGKITEEQIAMMEAREALKNYIEKDELMAKALGITVDELEAAKEEGQRMPDLLEELGIDPEDFEANMQAVHEEVLQQAVEDGIITQEQADQILENGLPGKRGPGGRGRVPRGEEGFPGRPGNGTRDGMNFQFPDQVANEG
jgi:hypothetical protein